MPTGDNPENMCLAQEFTTTTTGSSIDQPVCDQRCCDDGCYLQESACVASCPNCYPGDTICEYYYEICRRYCDQDRDQCVGGCHQPHIYSTSITAPVGGQFLSGTTAITARVLSNRAAIVVEFYAGGTQIGIVNRSDCGSTCDVVLDWNTAGAADGSYELWARARTDGVSASDSTRVTVTVDNTATVEITQPTDNAFFIDPITIQVATTVGPSGVQWVEFFVDEALIAHVTAAPFQAQWQDTSCVAREITPLQPCRRRITAKVANRAGKISPLSNLRNVIDANAIIRGADRYMREEGSFAGDLNPATSLNYTSAAQYYIGTATSVIPVAIGMYERVLLAFPTHATVTGTVKGHLITAIARLAEGYILAGNQAFVDALSGPGGSYTTLDINNAIAGLMQARQRFDRALDSYFALFTTSLPAPHIGYWALIRDGQPNHCDNYDRDYDSERYFPSCNGSRTPYWDWRVLGKAAGRKAFAARELAQARWSLSLPSDRDEAANVLAVAEIEAIGELTFLEGAITASLPTDLKNKIFATWLDLITEENELSRAIHYMAEGRNWVGLKRQTLQFVRADTDTQSNFDMHKTRATNAKTTAINSLTQLRIARRAFEQSAANYLNAQQSNLTHYNQLLSDLCGLSFEERCDSGRIRRQLFTIDIAKNKVEQVQTEINNAEARYRDAVQRQFDEQRIRRATIRYVLDGIYRYESLIDAEVELKKEAEESQGWFSVVTGVVQGVAAIVLAPEGGTFAFLAASAAAGGASSLGSGLGSLLGGGSSRAERQGAIDKQRVRLQALEKATVLEEGIELADLQYRTFILNTRLERQKLDIDLKGATLAYDQEVQQLASLFDELSRAFTERENWRLLNQVGSDNVFRDPTLRLFRDASLDGYTRDRYNMVWTAYGASLALIYELNKYAADEDIQWSPSDCGGCQPEIRSPDDLLRMLTPDRMQAAIDTLGYIWDRFRPLIEHGVIVQTRLSWLLGFRGPDAAVRLREYLYNHRVDSSNVFLTFPTNISVPLRTEDDPEFAPVLAPFWANLKIESVQAHILGGTDWTTFGNPFSLFLYYGFRSDGDQSQPVVGYLRRPDADIRYGATGADQINYYLYESMGPATLQAGTGARLPINWQNTPRNSKFLGRALGLDTWGMHICIDEGRCPGNSTLISSFDDIEDVYLRFICEGITLPFF